MTVTIMAVVKAMVRGTRGSGDQGRATGGEPRPIRGAAAAAAAVAAAAVALSSLALAACRIAVLAAAL